MVKCLRINTFIGRRLSRDAFQRVCCDYISELSAERQATARTYFIGNTIPGRGFLRTFLQRWPSLWQYRAGIIEEGRARDGRPEGVAHCFLTLQLLYRDLGVRSPRQV